MIRVVLDLRVEGNNKSIRGQNKAREEIERFVLSRYNMEKIEAKGREYRLVIPYATDKELDTIIYEEILAQAEQIADARHCFTEASVTALDDPGRSW